MKIFFSPAINEPCKTTTDTQRRQEVRKNKLQRKYSLSTVDIHVWLLYHWHNMNLMYLALQATVKISYNTQSDQKVCILTATSNFPLLAECYQYLVNKALSQWRIVVLGAGGQGSTFPFPSLSGVRGSSPGKRGVRGPPPEKFWNSTCRWVFADSGMLKVVWKCACF